MAISAIVAAISTTTTVLSGGTLAFGLFGAAATGFLAVATHFLITTALGAAMNALAPKPGLGGGIGGYKANAVGADLERQVIYGETRIGGAIVYSDLFDESNRTLEEIQVFAGHEVEEFVDWYIDGNRVTQMDPDGRVIEVELEDGTLSGIYDGYAWIREVKTGAPNGGPFTYLVNRYSGFPDPNEYWTNQHLLEGCAAAQFTWYYDVKGQRWPNGRPKVEAVIKGKKVYDPRSGTVEWTDNAILCIADFLKSDYGLAELDERIDWDMIADGANICDLTNTPGGEKRYSFNGAMLTSVPPFDFLSSALTTMGGAIWYAQGKWRLKPAYWTPSVLDINEDDLRGSVELNTRHSRRDNYNQVEGTFRGPETGYIQTNYPLYRNKTATTTIVTPGNFVIGDYYQINTLGTTDWNVVAGTTGVTYSQGDYFYCRAVGSGTGDAFSTTDFFLEVDNGERSSISLDQPFVDNSAQCIRLARIALERNREQLSINITTGLRSMAVQVGDNIRLSYDRFGWVNKYFEVAAWGFKITEDMEPLITMSLREVNPAVFNDRDDGERFEDNNTRLPNPFDKISVPTNLAYTSEPDIDDDGKTVADIEFTWDHPDAEAVEWYEFNYRRSGRTRWTDVGRIRNPNFALDNVGSHIIWEWRVRAVNGFGFTSAWAIGSNAAGDPDTTVPKAPINVGGSPGYRSARIFWDAVTQNTDNSSLRDFERYKVHRDGTLIGDTRGTSFNDNALSPSTNYAYTITAVDRSGNESALSLAGNVLTLADPADGVDGISVLVVYADDATGTNQSTTPGDREYVTYYEYNSASGTPSLPLPGGTDFVKFIGVGQGIWPIYADDAAGNNQSFTQGSRPFVNFYERQGSAPTLPRFVDEDGDPLVWVRVAADDGTPGDDAIGIYISGDDQTCTYDGDGAIEPASQDFNFEAIKSNTGSNVVNWTTSPNVKTGSGNTFSLDEADFGLDYTTANKKITVTATVNVDGTDYTDKMTVYALKDGSGGITVILTNEAVGVASDSDGGNPDLSQTDTGILCFQGIRQLSAVTGTPGKGQFRVQSTAYTGCTGPNTGSASGDTYTMGDLTGFTANNRGNRQFTVQVGTYPAGNIRTVQRKQSFSKSKQGNNGGDGDRGPGRWDIVLPAGVSLPTSSTQARNRWNTYGRSNGNNAPVRPVVDDQAWFRDENSHQAVAICQTVTSDTSHTWQLQDEVVDGNLLVTGTLNVFDAAVQERIRSSNFSNANETGFEIRNDGSATFYGPVISRPLELASGQFTLGGDFASATAFWVNSGIKMGKDDVWRAQKQGIIVTAAVRSGVYAQGSPDLNNSYWKAEAEVFGGARWNGANVWDDSPFAFRNDPTTTVILPDNTGTDQRLLFDVRVSGTSGIRFNSPVIAWKVFLVT